MTITSNALENNIEKMMNTKSIEGFKPYLMTDFDGCGRDNKICTFELNDIKLVINVYVRHGEGCTVAWKMYKNDQLSKKGDKFLTADYYDEKYAYQYAKGVFYNLIRLWIEETQKEEELI